MPPSHTCVAAGKSDRTDKPRHRIRFVIFLRRKQKFGSHHFRPSTQAIATLSPRPANPRPHETKRRIRMQGSLASQIFDATRGQSATREVAAPRNCIVVVLAPFTTPFSLSLLLLVLDVQHASNILAYNSFNSQKCAHQQSQKKKQKECSPPVSLPSTAHCHLVMLHPIG